MRPNRRGEPFVNRPRYSAFGRRPFHVRRVNQLEWQNDKKFESHGCASRDSAGVNKVIRKKCAGTICLGFPARASGASAVTPCYGRW
jgi:hypothetical protein